MRFKQSAWWLLVLLVLFSCGKNPFSEEPMFAPKPSLLTVLPFDTQDTLAYIGHYGMSMTGDGLKFHNGIDIGSYDNLKFFACAKGKVKEVILNTGEGSDGTNYRITIDIGGDVLLDYHFEINGSVSEKVRKSNIFVAPGDYVKAGQHIGTLIVFPTWGHVHFGISKGDDAVCPKPYFKPEVAAEFQRWYESMPNRPPEYPNLFE